jgi:hypothetical protein
MYAAFLGENRGIPGADVRVNRNQGAITEGSKCQLQGTETARREGYER